MGKFIIFWNAGYGESAEVVEAPTLDDANELSYDQWKEEMESNADYHAEPYSKELAEEYGLEEE